MLRRVRRLFTLPSGERALALQALGTLSVVRLMLWVLPFRQVRTVVDRWASSATADPDLALAQAVRRAVDRAARTLSGSDCLPQALTAELLLRRAGLPARVSIGVASDGQLLSAHAWVESAGFLVTGDSTDIDKYRTLVVYGSEMRATGET